eukprot:7558805-Pyramimonas_sp.AAC.1
MPIGRWGHVHMCSGSAFYDDLVNVMSAVTNDSCMKVRAPPAPPEWCSGREWGLQGNAQGVSPLLDRGMHRGYVFQTVGGVASQGLVRLPYLLAAVHPQKVLSSDIVVGPKGNTRCSFTVTTVKTRTLLLTRLITPKRVAPPRLSCRNSRPING